MRSILYRVDVIAGVCHAIMGDLQCQYKQLLNLNSFAIASLTPKATLLFARFVDLSTITVGALSGWR